MHLQSIRNALLLTLVSPLRDISASGAIIRGPQQYEDDYSVSVYDKINDRSADTGLERRQWPGWIPPTIRNSIAIAGIFGAIPSITWALYSLAKDCNEASELNKKSKEEGAEATASCTINAIGYVYTSVMAIASGISGVSTLATNPPEWLKKFWNGKRDLDSHNLISREALPHYASVFRTEVRHLGWWNDEPASLHRRSIGEDDDIILPVFGAKFGDTNVHFTHRDVQNNGSATLRLGFGHGTPQDGHLRSRDEPIFFQGGMDIDIKYMPVTNGVPVKDEFQFVLRYVIKQLDCLFYGDFAFPHQKANQIWLQIYDTEASGTVIASKIAIFGPDGESPLGSMGNYMSSLDIDFRCFNQGFQ